MIFAMPAHDESPSRIKAPQYPSRINPLPANLSHTLTPSLSHSPCPLVSHSPPPEPRTLNPEPSKNAPLPPRLHHPHRRRIVPVLHPALLINLMRRRQPVPVQLHAHSRSRRNLHP